MINPKCDFCGSEFEDYGALLFSPPDSESKTIKNHVCQKCYDKIKPKNKLEK